MMAKRKVGGRPARYKFLLNPYSDVRLSKCPICQKPTHPRKFALFIHVEGWGFLVLGKTSRYCTPCELVIVHRDELEGEMVRLFEARDPKVIGNDYLVVGTVEKKVWQAAKDGADTKPDEVLDHLAEFKSVYQLEVEPGGWGPARSD